MEIKIAHRVARLLREKAALECDGQSMPDNPRIVIMPMPLGPDRCLDHISGDLLKNMVEVYIAKRLKQIDDELERL